MSKEKRRGKEVSHQVRQDSEQFIPHGSFLEPWAFAARALRAWRLSAR